VHELPSVPRLIHEIHKTPNRSLKFFLELKPQTLKPKKPNRTHLADPLPHAPDEVRLRDGTRLRVLGEVLQPKVRVVVLGNQPGRPERHPGHKRLQRDKRRDSVKS
jgi:hypothetical protein